MVTSGFVPRYHQLKEIIRESVRSGAWKPGDLIPSERELAEQYGVSRMTARQSITELANEGLLYRQQGRGTYVARQRITQQLTTLTGFTEDIRARGQHPGTRVLETGMLPVIGIAAERLQTRPGQQVFHLRRLRLADSEPLAIERSLISFLGCEKLLDADLAHGSLYTLLETRFGVRPAEAEQELEAGLATEEDAAILQIATGSPVLLLRRTTYTARRQPIEYAESVYRGDKYTFRTHLVRPPDP